MSYTNAFDIGSLKRKSSPGDPTADAADAIGPGLSFDGPINPRDEAIFWLSAAAEIEHALMVQYLFAAYTLDPEGAGDQLVRVQRLQRTLLQIAREEMGHLITVQNILLALGGPLNFNRDHAPHTSDFHPFRFKLERASLASLAKYVVAESPDLAPSDIDMLSDERKTLLSETIVPQAKQNNDGQDVRHVGPIFARLIDIVKNELDPGVIQTGRSLYQADWSDWGYYAAKPDGPSDAKGGRVLVRRIDAENNEKARDQIVEALQTIGDQGEFVDGIDDLDESHFERFLQSYEQLAEIEGNLGRPATWPVASYPNTTVAQDPAQLAKPDAMLSRHLDQGRIMHPRSRDWGRLFNLRYHILLQTLIDGFYSDEPLYRAEAKQLGNRTAKGLLHGWAFAEMVRVKKLSRKLVSMPLDDTGSGKNAGPPFELPYSLQTPPFENDRWLGLAYLFDAGQAWIEEMRARHAEDADDPFLIHLANTDARDRAIALVLSKSGPPPEGGPDDDRFNRVVQALEDAVRGFDITDFPEGDRHGNFWAEKKRDDFVNGFVIFQQVIVPGSADDSELVDRISIEPGKFGSMPHSRPNIPPSRIELIRKWIDDGAPDAEPAGGVGLTREPAPKEEPRPVSDGDPSTDAPSFEQDIRELFTSFDRMEMLDWFDLHDYEAVKANAGPILNRLELGDMPCTGAWPAEDIAKFAAWVSAGCPA